MLNFFMENQKFDMFNNPEFSQQLAFDNQDFSSHLNLLNQYPNQFIQPNNYLYKPILENELQQFNDFQQTYPLNNDYITQRSSSQETEDWISDIIHKESIQDSQLESQPAIPIYCKKEESNTQKIIHLEQSYRKVPRIVPFMVDFSSVKFKVKNYQQIRQEYQQSKQFCKKTKNNNKFFMKKIVNLMLKSKKYINFIQMKCRKYNIPYELFTSYFNIEQIDNLQAIETIFNNSDFDGKISKIFKSYCKLLLKANIDIRIVIHSRKQNDEKILYQRSIRNLLQKYLNQ